MPFIACLIALCLSTLVVAQESVPPGIFLRIYNTAGMSVRDLHTAQRVLADIFLRAGGIEITWQECGKASASAARCAQVLTPDELVIRVVRSPIAAPGVSDVFGYSHVDTATRSGTLATVFGDRIQDVALRTHTDTGTLMGRVIAHEVGHLLLGSVDHSDEGVMRTRWPDAVVRRHRNGSTEWSFSPGEGIALRHGLVARMTESTEPAVLPNHSVRDGSPLLRKLASATCEPGCPPQDGPGQGKER